MKKKPEEKAQSRDSELRQERVMVRSARNEHDTPPPVLVVQGSLIIEMDQPDFDQVAPGSSTQPKKHRRGPKQTGATRVFPAHIKVIDGSGDLLYRNDIADDCLTSILLGTEEVTLSAVGTNFEITTRDDRDLVKSGNQFDQPIQHDPSHHLPARQARYRYKNRAGAEFRITGARIIKRSTNEVLYAVTLEDLPSKGEEFRVLIWLEEA